MKRFFALLITAAILTLSFAACSPAAPTVTTEPPVSDEPPATEAATEAPDNTQGDKFMNKVYATIVVKEFGTIRLELYPDLAPESVRNFCYLARMGFYEGLTFHRIIFGFMIQGGDPDGNGGGGPGYCIKGEFAANGFENELKHTRGVISWARRSRNMDSAGSQFFIMHQDAPHLDGQYAAFGKVIEGIEVVDAIASVQTDSAGMPYTPVVIESVTIDGPELPEPEKLN